MYSVKVRCKVCNREIVGKPGQTVSCGCSNMATIRGDKISAVDLSQVIMVNSVSTPEKKNHLTQEDILWQEERRQRKVRKLDFEVRQERWSSGLRLQS